MEMEYSIMCVSFTGIAAANLPNGRTIHNHFNFTINDLKKSTFVPDLSTDKLNQLHSRLTTSKLILLLLAKLTTVYNNHEGGKEEGPLWLKSDAMLLLPLAKD
ncbi:hypothetical protein OUZ56_016326 [Daphnia magna]|uniref:ATP-dependent DNA helicase n=1 Tax=Daphnia magna TaxID=35525 RepID=A0ABR0AQB7_9CRUS|nr:hypothetical protein OUZ56_016326 [Daphnia magna]